MTHPIGGAENGLPVNWPLGASGTSESKSGTEAGFQNLLIGSLTQTNAMQQSAENAVAEHLAGGDPTQVEVFSAVKKADLALRTMVQVRNKLLDAYQEIQRMQM